MTFWYCALQTPYPSYVPFSNGTISGNGDVCRMKRPRIKTVIFRSRQGLSFRVGFRAGGFRGLRKFTGLGRCFVLNNPFLPLCTSRNAKIG